VCEWRFQKGVHHDITAKKKKLNKTLREFVHHYKRDS